MASKRKSLSSLVKVTYIILNIQHSCFLTGGSELLCRHMMLLQPADLHIPYHVPTRFSWELPSSVASLPPGPSSSDPPSRAGTASARHRPAAWRRAGPSAPVRPSAAALRSGRQRGSICGKAARSHRQYMSSATAKTSDRPVCGLLCWVCAWPADGYGWKHSSGAWYSGVPAAAQGPKLLDPFEAMSS